MPLLRTYLVIPALGLVGVGPFRAAAQDPVNAHTPPPAVERCGSGTLTVSVGGEPVGEEQYEVRCAEDGSMFARGTTRIALGGLTADYTVEMTLDSSAVPSLVTAIGTTSSGPMNDTLTMRGAQSALTRGGTTQPVSASAGAAYMGNNLFWPVVFLLARYDEGEGGEQKIPVFPSLAATLTYAGADTVTPATGGSGAARTYHRYALGLGPAPIFAWTDASGRFAAMVVPAARLIVNDTRDAAYSPALAAVGGTAAAPPPPDYSVSPDAPYTAEEVTVNAGGHTLAGTLLIPKGGSAPHPAAITITGSGQQTRDEALPIPGLGDYAPFRQIAETLAARGIAVLRVDDRGVGGSTGTESLQGATSTSFADDARAQLRFLRARPDIDGTRIALIGHSEGANIAPMIAAGDSNIAALVLMAGTATRGDSVLLEQMEDLLARDTTMSTKQRNDARQQQREVLRKLAAGESVPGLSGAAWLREFIAYDPLSVIPDVHQPVLILQGANDRQVLAHHARKLAAAFERAGNEQVTLRIYPSLNHLFLPSETGAVSEYGSLPDVSLGEDLLVEIGNWLVRELNVGGSRSTR